MKKLVIKNSQWARGYSSALKDDEKYCCLGLHAKACGFTDRDLDDISGPRLLHEEFTRKKKENHIDYFETWLDKFEDENEEDFFCTNTLCSNAVEINDEYHLTDEERIEALSKIFAEVGIKIIWEPKK